MATVTKLPIAFAETMASVLETSNVEALAPQEVSTHIGMCVYLQGLFFLLGVFIMVQFVIAAQRVEPFTASD